MVEHISYPSLERTEMLRSGGLELLGKIIHWTEKRDGSNISIWPTTDLELGGKMLDVVSINGVDHKIVVSSRHQKVAAGDFISRFKSTKEYSRAVEYLKEFPQHVIFGELIPAGATPTRIEPNHKKPSYHVFDIYDREFDKTGGRFLGYTAMYQQMYHYKIPIVKLLAITRHNTLQMNDDEKALIKKWDHVKNAIKGVGSKYWFETETGSSAMDGISYYWIRDILLTWCRVHRREGVIAKTFDGLDCMYVKEKVDMPSLGKIRNISKEVSVQLPPLPESEIMGAISKVHTDNGDQVMMDKAKAMPLIANAIKEECKKHLCSAPSGKLFDYYRQYMSGLVKVVY